MSQPLSLYPLCTVTFQMLTITEINSSDCVLRYPFAIDFGLKPALVELLIKYLKASYILKCKTSVEHNLPGVHFSIVSIALILFVFRMDFNLTNTVKQLSDGGNSML